MSRAFQCDSCRTYLNPEKEGLVHVEYKYRIAGTKPLHLEMHSTYVDLCEPCFEKALPLLRKEF